MIPYIFPKHKYEFYVVHLPNNEVESKRGLSKSRFYAFQGEIRKHRNLHFYLRKGKKPFYACPLKSPITWDRFDELAIRRTMKLKEIFSAFRFRRINFATWAHLAER